MKTLTYISALSLLALIMCGGLTAKEEMRDGMKMHKKMHEKIAGYDESAAALVNAIAGGEETNMTDAVSEVAERHARKMLAGAATFALGLFIYNRWMTKPEQVQKLETVLQKLIAKGIAQKTILAKMKEMGAKIKAKV